ncbi:MAG: PD-(D/E)XK nuclease family protein [Candidatus Altiarchaeota archaeon]|nr:PD-(D/E)XK nuclease family protein [Candidatus Altiarchaeota archaeon]
MRYSHSKLRCFRRCPLAFRFEYVDRLDAGGFETVESFMGSRVHDALDYFYSRALKCGSGSLEDLLMFYCGVWNDKMHPGVVVNRADRSLEDYMLLGYGCLADYFRRHEPFDGIRTLRTEMRVEADLLGDGRYVFTGFIDRLDYGGDGSYEIHDYKTGRKTGDRGQLSLYELGLRQGREDVGDVGLVYHYLRCGTEVRFRNTPADLEDLGRDLLRAVREIENALVEDIFPAKRTPLCAWCAFQEECGEYEKRKRMRQTRLGAYL